ncbi:MAG: KEOPS complex kinase/ATPase Bud32 [Candidatus Hodarchaeales archaeon]|jgi:TP53 regulating kinase-like protein
MSLTINKELAKGAEAIISSGTFLDLPIIIKHRVPKLYRHSKIDSMIRLHRIRAEAKIMTYAWKIGVNVPSLFGIDIQNYSLFIESVQGDLLYEILKTTSMKELLSIFSELGNQIGILHSNEIIHGDLTVFNVIVNSQKKTCIIDFGLAKISVELEAKADDLLTFYSTLKAINLEFQNLFESFLQGYLKVYSEGKKTYQQMKKIQSRARYVAREERLV